VASGDVLVTGKRQGVIEQAPTALRRTMKSSPMSRKTARFSSPIGPSPRRHHHRSERGPPAPAGRRVREDMTSWTPMAPIGAVRTTPGRTGRCSTTSMCMRPV